MKDVATTLSSNPGTSKTLFVRTKEKWFQKISRGSKQILEGHFFQESLWRWLQVEVKVCLKNVTFNLPFIFMRKALTLSLFLFSLFMM